jgi:hypothetical protein
MDLSLLGGSCGIGLELAAGNLIKMGSSPALGQSANVVSVSGVNISAGMTQMMSVDIPVGEVMMLRKLSFGNLTTTAADLSVQIEIDGVVVATGAITATAETGVTAIGCTQTGTQPEVTNVLQDIIVKSNLKISANKSPASAASVTITYVKLKRG